MKTAVLKFAPGSTVSFHGEPCIVLEHCTNGTLLMAANSIERTFGTSNNFAVSDLRAHLNGAFLEALTENHPDEVLEREIDLTALNGSKEYGSVHCKVAPLTLDELRKYHSIIPRPERWEWSITPWSTPCVNEDDTWVMGLHANGGVGSRSCSDSSGSRPAFLIPSDFAVEVEDAEENNSLAAHTTQELLAEISRRID